MPILPREARRLRLSTGLSLAQWAACLEIDQAAVVQIEAGTLPLLGTLEAQWRHTAYIFHLERPGLPLDPGDDTRKVVTVEPLALRAWKKLILSCNHSVSIRCEEPPARMVCEECKKRQNHH